MSFLICEEHLWQPQLNLTFVLIRCTSMANGWIATVARRSRFTIPPPKRDSRMPPTRSENEPAGQAGQIRPSTYPLLMAAWQLAPSLAAGCTCVLKPAEQTPVTVLEMANWFADIGRPPGAVNIITGFGESAGAPLVQHAGVDKVAFTGSAAVGKQIV